MNEFNKYEGLIKWFHRFEISIFIFILLIVFYYTLN